MSMLCLINTRLHQPKTKSMRRHLSSLPERSWGRILHTSQFFNTDQWNDKEKSIFWGVTQKQIWMYIPATPILGKNLHSSVDQLQYKIGKFEIKHFSIYFNFFLIGGLFCQLSQPKCLQFVYTCANFFTYK